MKINKVPDTALLFRAAAWFNAICYLLRGTNVLKIQSTNTCCKKYLITNAKYIKINVFKYRYKIQYFVFQIRILYFKYKIQNCILNAKYIPSLQYTRLLVPRKGMLTPL